MSPLNGPLEEAGLAAHGVEAESLQFSGSSPHGEFLSFFNTIDIALDPFPFSGGLTTCEALWCGVPIITLPGETFSSRHSHCYVSIVGHSEWSVGTLNRYVETARELASAPDALANARLGLRTQMANSPLCDSKQFSTELRKQLLKEQQYQVLISIFSFSKFR